MQCRYTEIAQRIFKHSNIQYTSLTADKILNNLVYRPRTLFYVNIYRSYKLSENSPVFWPTLYMCVCILQYYALPFYCMCFIVSNSQTALVCMLILWFAFVKLIKETTYLLTYLVISLKHLSYKDRLVQLGLPTLKCRRLRGNMIEVFKIIIKNMTVQ